MTPRSSRALKEVAVALAIAAPLLAAAVEPASASPAAPRWFADRPVAWAEHDDADVPAPPEANHLQDLDASLTIRDSMANEVERVLAVDPGRPASDVNALDEVPCSTWFCARNHLRPLTDAELLAGPPASPPTLPLRIVKGKDQGATAGFQVVDAAGRKFMLKFSPAGHLGLATGGEAIGHRVFHALGYNVPGAFVLNLQPQDLTLDPRATFKLRNVEKRPLTAERVNAQLQRVAHHADGRIRAVAVPWIGGQVLGSFDMLGRRPGDPNDRIAHEDRRSLRASWVIFAWLAELDPSAINTIDSYVAEGGKHFVRHYFIDFGDAFGSAMSPHQDGEYLVEVGRSLRALVSLGLYHRPFQDERTEWRESIARYPSIGYFPAEDFDPAAFRTNRKVPPHMRLTDRDAYWGAKLVTSFSDAQLATLVGAAELPSPDAAYVIHALRVRRDILGRRYLRAVAAVEDVALSEDGARVCFEDLAVARGYIGLVEGRHAIEVADGRGNRLAAYEQAIDGPRACVSIGGVGRGTGYRVIEVRTRFTGEGGTVSKAARIHLRWRDGERRFAVVGLERDE